MIYSVPPGDAAPPPGERGEPPGEPPGESCPRYGVGDLCPSNL